MTEKKDGLWLNLGCGDKILEKFVNVDIRVFTKEDYEKAECLWFDLNAPVWRWNNCVDYILAHDIIEHLSDKIQTMNNIWLALKGGGIVDIEVPTTDGPGAFQDPTHVSFWNERSFLYYEKGNIYRERFAESYGIKAAFEILQSNVSTSMDGPRLKIILRAVK